MVCESCQLGMKAIRYRHNGAQIVLILPLKRAMHYELGLALGYRGNNKKANLTLSFLWP